MCYNLDWIVFLVTVLSVLVMLLLGWQIFNVLSFEKKVDRKIRKREKRTNDKFTNLDLYNTGMLNLLNAQNFYNIQQYEKSIEACFEAIKCFSLIDNKTEFSKENNENVEKQIRKCLDIILDLNKVGVKSISKKNKTDYLHVLSKIYKFENVPELQIWIKGIREK